MKLRTRTAGIATASILLLGLGAACGGSEELPDPTQEINPPPGLKDSPREEES